MYLLRRCSRLLLIATLAAFAFFLYTNRAGVDNRGPGISVKEPLLEISVEDPEEALLEGVTASDPTDGDVTDSVEVENISTFYSDKKRLVTYVAFDSDGHVARATRELHYSDYESPRFFLEEPLQYLPGSVNLKVSARDCLDGDITSAIKLVSDDVITTAQPGSYKATFQVANSAGDVSSLPVTIEILDKSMQGAPSIHLSTYLDYVPLGSAFDPYAYVESVMIGNREYRVVPGEGNYNRNDVDRDEEIVVGTEMVPVRNPVNTSEPGTYRVTYSITIDRGHTDVVTSSASLYIVVR